MVVNACSENDAAEVRSKLALHHFARSGPPNVPGQFLRVEA